MKKKIIIAACVALAVLLIIIAIACGPIKLSAPEKLTATYDGNGNIEVSWDKVKKAERYVITDGTQSFETENCTYVIDDAEEGITHSISVQAVTSKGSKTYKSEEAVYWLEVPIMLGRLNTIRYNVAGTYYYLNWDMVEGASSYELKLGEDGQVYPLSKNSARLTDIADGLEYNVYISAVRNVGSHVYKSDWSRFDISVPQYDYSSMSFEVAIDFDLDRLTRWAKTSGYKIDIEEKDGMTFADVHYKDSANSGIANGIGRFIGGLLGGYMLGAAESAENTYNEDLSEIDSMVGAFIEAGGIKEYASEKSEEIQSAGKAGALVYGLKSLLTDTDVHFIYRYSDTKDAALVCEMYMLNMNHESYLRDRYASFDVGEDGLYHLSSNYTHNSIKVYTDVKNLDIYDYNVVVVGHDN